MASFSIHLAIGKRYFEKSKIITNEKEFFRGIIDPDLVEDKKISHYTGIQDKTDLSNYLLNKVLLYRFLLNEKIDTDYQKGVFLHLISDYLFFNTFFDKDYLLHISYSDFCKDLYYSYDITNDYLERKYNISYTDFLDKIKDNIRKDQKEKNVSSEIRTNILPFSKLDNFIEYVSNINLHDYSEKIIKNKENVLP